MKVAIENMLKDIDPEALTPQGKIHSYKNLGKSIGIQSNGWDECIFGSQ